MELNSGISRKEDGPIEQVAQSLALCEKDIEGYRKETCADAVDRRKEARDDVIPFRWDDVFAHILCESSCKVIRVWSARCVSVGI